VASDPAFWLRIKKVYNEESERMRRGMDWWYIWAYVMGRNPIYFPAVLSRIARHRFARGMSLIADIRDWLGGWPMEFVRDKDVIDRLAACGFRLINCKTGEACSEFVFKRTGKGG
jgi:2-polyprenyl-6-hydroxyphenyl methylase/3-demethylubiquinone-9 3-methyltransferase